METVRVKVFGAGSLEVEGYDSKGLLKQIKGELDRISLGDSAMKVREIKRGPKKKEKIEKL